MKYTNIIQTMRPNKEIARLEVDRLKGMFLKIIIQELRSPMSAILGFADMLRQDDDQNEQVIESVTRASMKSQELLDIALVVSEVDAEKTAASVRPYKVSDLFEYALKDHKDIISEKNLEIQMPAEREITEVVINPTLIKEVVRIFIQNAVFHSRAGGTVVLDINESIDRIVLNISDSGNGFDLEFLEKASTFLKSKDLTNRSQWPGLRFAIAKYIMDMHYAEIIIENNADGGASAKLIFPVNNDQLEELHQSLSQLN